MNPDLIELNLVNKGYLVIFHEKVYVFLNKDLSPTEQQQVYENLILSLKEDFPALE